MANALDLYQQYTGAAQDQAQRAQQMGIQNALAPYQVQNAASTALKDNLAIQQQQRQLNALNSLQPTNGQPADLGTIGNALLGSNPTLAATFLGLDRQQKATQSLMDYRKDQIAIRQKAADPLGLNSPTPAQPNGQIAAPGQPAQPSAETAAPNLNHDFLQTLPPGVQTQVQAVVDGRLMPNPRTPVGQQLLQLATQVDPTFDAVNYNARSKALQNFTSGNGAVSNNAISTAIGHLAHLQDNVQNLDNSNVIPGIVNPVENFTSKYVLGNTNVTNFEGNALPLAQELTKAYRGAGGSEADVQGYLDKVLDKDAGKDQQMAAIKQIAGLLQSKIDANKNQFQQAMGNAAGLHANLQFLTPGAQAALAKIQGGTASGQPPAANAQGWQLHVDKNGDKAYVSPDGTQFQAVQ